MSDCLKYKCCCRSESDNARLTDIQLDIGFTFKVIINRLNSEGHKNIYMNNQATLYLSLSLFFKGSIAYTRSHH